MGLKTPSASTDAIANQLPRRRPTALVNWLEQ